MNPVPSPAEIDQYRQIAAWFFGLAMIIIFFVIWASISWPENGDR